MSHSIQPIAFSRAVCALLQSNQLPTSDLEAGMEVSLFAAGATQQPAGVVGIQVFESAALLRSLAVLESERGRGLGSALVRYVEQHLASIGISTIYLLTTTAAKFFEAHGYSTANRKEAPVPIAATSQFSSLCPASSAFMVKVLRAQQVVQTADPPSAGLPFDAGVGPLKATAGK